jgi:NTP pyrophosphatase (non-canonical NTP hydrolase)
MQPPLTSPDSELNERMIQLKSEIAEFCAAREWDKYHDLKELAIGIVTEASELLDLFRFRSIAESEAMLNTAPLREKIEDELADVLFFLLRISGKYQIDLASALERKMKKNAAKYPVEKARGNNLKYDELDQD